jgi:hypothetical protein
MKKENFHETFKSLVDPVSPDWACFGLTSELQSAGVAALHDRLWRALCDCVDGVWFVD